MVFPLIAAAVIGAAGTAYAANKANKAANAQSDVANAYNWETFQQTRADVQVQRAQDRAWQIEDREWAVANSRINFAQMRDDALAAGFNPSSALGHAGAYAGAPAAMGAMRGQPTVVGAPDYVMPQIGVSSSSFIGDALSNFATGLRDYSSAIVDRETQIAVVREEHAAKMEQLKTASTAYRGAGYSIPKAVAAAGTVASEPPKIPGAEYDEKPSLGVRVGGSYIDAHPGYSNSAEVAERYDDAVSGIYGAILLPRDIAYAATNQFRRNVAGARQTRKEVADMVKASKSPAPPRRPYKFMNHWDFWGDYSGHSSGRIR